MKVIQVAKYYPPLSSAQAFQATKLTEALESTGINVEVICGLKDDAIQLERDNLTPIRYSDNYFKSKKINKVIKEILQLTQFNRWIKKSVLEIEKILNTNSSQILLTQSTPLECHLLGYYFKKKYNTKWVAAFSDPFPISIAPEPYKGSNYIPFISFFQKKVLKKILINCDHILVSSYYSFKLMCDFCSIPVSDNYSIIPHIGMDVEGEKHNEENNGWLIHTGNLTKERVVEELFVAIKKIKDYNTDFKGIKFIGKVCNSFERMLEDYELEDYVMLIDEVSQSKIYSLVKECSGLLVIEANMESSPFLPSKFADYATLGKPIIAITPMKSEIRNYLKEFGGGIASNHNVIEIETSITQIIKNKVKASPRLINHFTHANVGQVYYNILKKV